MNIRSKLVVASAACLAGFFLSTVTVIAVAPPPPENVIAGELTPGGSGTARVTWNPSPGATAYKIYKKNTAVDSFSHDSSATLSGTTAQLSGLDDFDSYLISVVAVNSLGEESNPDHAAVPFACRRTPFSLEWDDQHFSPGASFAHLNHTISTVSKLIPHNNEAYRVTINSAGTGLVVNASAGSPMPIRFTGMNITWSAAFPSVENAPKIAARMAQFGINMVRFHGLDAYAANETDTRYIPYIGWFEGDFTTLVEAKLVLFDNFINELAKQGIYSNINLCVGRKFLDETNPSGTSYQRFKGLDQMDPVMIQKQKDFATTLLNRTNSYRGGVAYKNDPAIAVLEINNEASLIYSWAGGVFDPGSAVPLIGAYDTQLKERWSNWLRTTRGYGSVDNAALQAQWAADTHSYARPGVELLTDQDFVGFGTTGHPWIFQKYGVTATSDLVPSVDVGGTTRNALRVNVGSTSTSPGAIKILYSPLSSSGSRAFDYKTPHWVQFHARVEEGAERTLTVAIRRNASPYPRYHEVKVKLTSEWQQYDVLLPNVLSGPTTLDLEFADFASATGKILFAGPSLKEGNPFVPSTAKYAEHTTVLPADAGNLISETFPTSGNLPWPTTTGGAPASNAWTLANKTTNSPTAGFTSEGYLRVYRNASYYASTGDLYVQRVGLNLVPGRSYELTFEARFTQLPGSGETETRIAFSAGTVGGTLFGSGLGEVEKAAWSTHRLGFVATAAGSRIALSMGRLRGTLDFRNIEVRERAVAAVLPSDTLVGSGTAAWPTRAEFRGRTRAFQRDWMNFLWDTETAYFKGMRDHLKGTAPSQLGAKQLIIGSQGEYSPNYLQAQHMDIIDVHGYWNHPASTDGQNYVANNSMAGVVGAGSPGQRQNKRVLGKPFFCTEYNHPHPMTFGSEAFPLIAAFAGFHGWDGVVGFHYEDTNAKWNRGFEDSHYAIGRSAGKMVNFPFLAQSLRNGLFERAERTALLVVNKDSVIDVLLGRMNSDIGMTHFSNGAFTFPVTRALEIDTATTMDDPLNAGSMGIAYAAQPSVPVASAVSVFDSGEQIWDSTAGQETVQIIAPKVKALIGKLDPNTTYDLFDDVSLKPRASMQSNGASAGRSWSGYALTLKEGANFGAAGSRWLLSTMGYTDNLFRKWDISSGPYDTNNKIAAGDGNGIAPNFVERIGGELKVILAGSNRLMAWDLDEQGNRIAPLAVSRNGNVASVALPDSPVSPWYEFSVEATNTPFAMSCLPTNGYTVGLTALGVKDTALAGNSATDTEAPFKNVQWVSTTTDPSVPADKILRATNGVYLYSGDTGYSLSLFDGGTGCGAKIDLRGQNIPMDKSWSFEAALRFDSTTLNGDEFHAVIGQDKTMPVVEVALVRNPGYTVYDLRVRTGSSWTTVKNNVADKTFVKVRVAVTPPNVDVANPNGKVDVHVDGTLIASNLQLPSQTNLPEEIHLFTPSGTTGIATIDAIKVTIP